MGSGAGSGRSRKSGAEWTDNVYPDDDVYPDDMTRELDNLFANNLGWSPAFKKAATAETKRLRAMHKRQGRIAAGLVVPRLERKGRTGRVVARF